MQINTPKSFQSLLAMEFHDNAALWGHPQAQSLLEKMNLDDASVAAAKAAVTTHEFQRVSPNIAPVCRALA
jgi:hypothetical protein